MKKLLLVVFLAALVGCQDHHFVPIDKADSIVLPKLPEERAGKSFESGGKAQKFVMSGDYRDEKVPEVQGKLIVEGTISLGQQHAERDFKGYTLYVISRNAQKDGELVAVSKYNPISFPFPFRLGEKDLMAASFPEDGSLILVEARLDGDGDVVTKLKGDLIGFAPMPVLVGTTDLTLTLDNSR